MEAVIFIVGIVVVVAIIIIVRNKKQSNYDDFMDKARDELLAHDFNIEKEIVLDKYTKRFAYHAYMVAFDNHKQEVAFINADNGRILVQPYKNLTSYELYENSNIISSGSIGASLVGGVLGGLTGAVIGSNATKHTSTKQINDLKLVIRLQDFQHPIFEFDLIDFEVKTTDDVYKDAINNISQVLASLEYIKNKNGQESK